MNYGIYKNIDTLPIINWHLLLKSQKDGNIELRYLLKVDIDADFPNVDVAELIPIYESLTEQIPDMDLSFVVSAVKYELNYSKHVLTLQYRDACEVFGREQIEVSDIELNRAFSSYITELSKVYDSFRIREYYFENNIQSTYGVDSSMFDFLNGITFYHSDQLIKLVESEKPDLLKVVNNQVFFNNFIRFKEIDLNDIRTLDSRLAENYKDEGKYEDYQKVRFELFNLENLTGVKISNSEYTIFDEIVNLNKITGYKLDVKNSTVSELIAVRKIAKKIIEQHEKQNQK